MRSRAGRRSTAVTVMAAVVLSIVLVMAACASPGRGGASGPGVSWRQCNGGDGPRSYDCATLQVPLDYANPHGRLIGVALARHRATGKKIGSVLVNPGGPGASGIDFVDPLLARLGSSVVTHFDIVGFDPRGTKRSVPVTCETGPELDRLYHLDPAPASEAGFQQLVAATRTYVQGCQARNGDVLPFMGTSNTARDMDAIRAVLGDPKLNYLGFSYGTFLGVTYADLFPTHIRAMVLDGAVDPALGPVENSIEAGAGFDQELNAFFAYCSHDSTCAWKPAGAAKADYDALVNRIAAHAVPATGGRALGPGEAYLGVAGALYNQATWPDLATGLAKADAGDGSALLGFFDAYTSRNPNGEYDNVLDAEAAIQCADQAWPRDPAVLEHAAPMARQRAPEFGVGNLYGGLVCTVWPDPATGAPHAVSAPASPAIVVVGSTGDPATPYQNAQALARELAHGVLLTRRGDGHAGYTNSACIREHVDSYFVNLVVPPAGVTCPTP